MSIPSVNSLTTGAGGLFVPDEIAREFNALLRDKSAVEPLVRHVPMTRNRMVRRMQADGVRGYWVEAMEVKPKDAPSFEVYELVAQKLAVIVPVDDQLLEDADTDIAAIIRQDVVGAFAEDLDRTYLGYEPTSPFADSLSGNTPAANTVAYGTLADLAGDFSLAMQALEVNGYEATGAVTHPAVKHIMRNMRDLNNQPLFHEDLSSPVPRYTFYGVPINFTRQCQSTGSPAGYELILFQGDYVFIGDRLGLQVSMSTEATLTQGTESPINLFEQDMTAFRFVTRKAFTIKRDDALAKITGIS